MAAVTAVATESLIGGRPQDGAIGPRLRHLIGGGMVALARVDEQRKQGEDRDRDTQVEGMDEC